MPQTPPLALGSRLNFTATGVADAAGAAILDLGNASAGGHICPRDQVWELALVTTLGGVGIGTPGFAPSVAVATCLLMLYRSTRYSGDQFIAHTYAPVDETIGEDIFEVGDHLVGVYTGYTPGDELALTGYFVPSRPTMADTLATVSDAEMRYVEGSRTHKP